MKVNGLVIRKGEYKKDFLFNFKQELWIVEADKNYVFESKDDAIKFAKKNH